MPAYLAPLAAVILAVYLQFVRLAVASPLLMSEARRDVVAPPVTVPNASTVWVVGETRTVAWDTSNLPAQITNPQGTILLGFVNDTSGDEHLMIDNPLATGFNITSGSVDVVVPDVESRTDYIIALLGDSGDISDKFTILNPTASSTATTPSTISSSAASASGSASLDGDSTATRRSTDHPTTSASLTASSTQPAQSSVSRSGTLQSTSSQSSITHSASTSGSTSTSQTNLGSSSTAVRQSPLSGCVSLVPLVIAAIAFV